LLINENFLFSKITRVLSDVLNVNISLFVINYFNYISFSFLKISFIEIEEKNFYDYLFIKK